MAKGYSKDVDSARLISVFHTLNAAVQANVWWEYVASAANIADLPSRGALGLLEGPEYRAERFEVKWPPLDAWDGGLAEFYAATAAGPAASSGRAGSGRSARPRASPARKRRR